MKKKIIYSTFAVMMAVAVASTATSAEAFGNQAPRGQQQQQQNQGWGQNQSQNTTLFSSTSAFNSSNAASYLQQLMEQLAALQAQMIEMRGENSDVAVATLQVTDIEEDEATLNGSVRKLDEDATVWFEYGETRDDLEDTTSEVSVDEDDEGDTFEATITGLDEDTRYYFRAVIEDEDGDEHYGVLRAFHTDDGGTDEDDPDVDTDDADDVTDDSAELNGSVDMNDFNNGYVFFIYGEDEDAVEDTEDEDDYSDIDEDGDDLQKEVVDADLDSDDTYVLDIDGLDSNTTYYFRIAVEYEDEDDDTVVVYGDVESFTTDED